MKYNKKTHKSALIFVLPIYVFLIGACTPAAFIHDHEFYQSDAFQVEVALISDEAIRILVMDKDTGVHLLDFSRSGVPLETHRIAEDTPMTFLRLPTHEPGKAYYALSSKGEFSYLLGVSETDYRLMVTTTNSHDLLEFHPYSTIDNIMIGRFWSKPSRYALYSVDDETSYIGDIAFSDDYESSAAFPGMAMSVCERNLVLLFETNIMHLINRQLDVDAGFLARLRGALTPVKLNYEKIRVNLTQRIRVVDVNEKRLRQTYNIEPNDQYMWGFFTEGISERRIWMGADAANLIPAQLCKTDNEDLGILLRELSIDCGAEDSMATEVNASVQLEIAERCIPISIPCGLSISETWSGYSRQMTNCRYTVAGNVVVVFDASNANAELIRLSDSYSPIVSQVLTDASELSAATDYRVDRKSSSIAYVTADHTVVLHRFDEKGLGKVEIDPRALSH